MGSDARSNVVLVGFMGSGKSSVGRELARMLEYGYVDTDEEIVRAAGGRAVPEIFQEEGEEGFRQRERLALGELAGGSGMVVSTGGGLPVDEANRRVLREMGYVVWLDAAPETIFGRVARNQDRPLLQVDDPEARVREMLEERRPVYEEVSDLRVKTDGLDLAEVAYGVAESARLHLAGG